MKAVVIHEFGNTSTLEETELPRPKPMENQVLIKVKATSVNPLDYKLRKGDMPNLITKFPATLHGDVSGVIEEIGPNVQEYNIADEVYGCVGGIMELAGALAEYVVADVNFIAKKPKTLSFKEAASIPLVAETAWEAFVNKANIKCGDKVLVHGGTGGLGQFSIMLAKHFGAEVFTTVSTDDKAKIAESIGAAHTINYKKETVEEYVTKHTNGIGFNIVLDTVGGDNIEKCINAVAANGHVISVLGGGSHNLDNLFFKNANLHMVLQPLPLISGQNKESHKVALSEVAKIIDEENLKPLIDKSNFSIREVAKAHDYLEEGKAIGKVVLENDF